MFGLQLGAIALYEILIAKGGARLDGRLLFTTAFGVAAFIGLRSLVAGDQLVRTYRAVRRKKEWAATVWPLTDSGRGRKLYLPNL